MRNRTFTRYLLSLPMIVLVVQDEKWVKMPDGWKRGDIFEVIQRGEVKTQ